MSSRVSKSIIVVRQPVLAEGQGTDRFPRFRGSLLFALVTDVRPERIQLLRIELVLGQQDLFDHFH